MNAILTTCLVILSHVILHAASGSDPCRGEFCNGGWCERMGCEICLCPDEECMKLSCDPGTRCIIRRKTDCTDSPCFTEPECETIESATSTENSDPENTVATTVVNPDADDTCLIDVECSGDFCERVRDQNGCYSCQCPNLTCENITCTSGYRCQMRQVRHCVMAPCFPNPMCRPSEETTDVPDCLRSVDCPDDCQPEMDDRGCYACVCPKVTCATVLCITGTTCVMKRPDTCSTSPCLKAPVCERSEVVPVTPEPWCKDHECDGDLCRRMGCKNCFCLNRTCEDFVCDPGKQCVMKRPVSPCFEPPCFMEPVCESNESVISGIPAWCVDNDVCDGEKCREMGCEACICPNRNCDNFFCDLGTRCIMRKTRCLSPPCFMKPECESTPATENPDIEITTATENPDIEITTEVTPENSDTKNTMTTTFSDPGSLTEPTTEVPGADNTCLIDVVCSGDFCERVRDQNGCYSCQCATFTCENITCNAGYRCVMRRILQCETAPCFPTPVCEPVRETCTSAVCRALCELDIGPEGCRPTCSCPRTCQHIRCRANEVCETLETNCADPPCFPIPVCLPRNKICSGRPNVQRCFNESVYAMMWSYNSVTRVCSRFRYYGCTPSPNTFASLSQCATACLRPCPFLRCAQNCFETPRMAGRCPRCVCPCESVECLPGYVCRWKKPDCFEGPCEGPKPFCLRIRECPPFRCDIACLDGFASDETGCPLCRCL